MIKLKFFVSSATFAFLALACNSDNTDNTMVEDSTHSNNVVDSMPVINTPVTDSSAVIITPPVNDDNVVNPDSSKK